MSGQLVVEPRAGAVVCELSHEPTDAGPNLVARFRIDHRNVVDGDALISDIKAAFTLAIDRLLESTKATDRT